MDFDERVSVGSNMYLPSCTYYVPGADFSTLPSFLSQSPSSRSVPYSFSSNLPQVQHVREVTFRDYAIDASSKWPHRGPLAQCYPPEDIVHRECLAPPTTVGEIFPKNNSSAYYHTSHASSVSNFYGGGGRNGVLPQAFDQFFDTAYVCSDSAPNSDYAARDKQHSSKQATVVPAPEQESGEKERQETSSPESSSGNKNEEKISGANSMYERSERARKFAILRAPVKFFICGFISV